MNPMDFPSTAAGRPVRTQAGYWAFIPVELPPDITWSSELVSQLGQAERHLSQLSAQAMTFPFQRLLIDPFVRAEAVVSSRIEGTRATLADVYLYESAQKLPRADTGDVREVHNYVRAMDYGLERIKTFPVSLRLIRELHAILLEGVRGGYLTPGEFRRSQNWIGPSGSTINTAPYVPPPADEMNVALDALEKFIHADSPIPALARIGLLHYQFEAIHPFLDGNGRVGRLLNVLLLCDWGLLSQPLLNLSAYFERYRQEYYDRLLAVSQRGEWIAWLLFYLRGVSEQASISVARIDQLGNMRTRYISLARTRRNSQLMLKAIDLVFTRPVLTINQVAAELRIPFTTAGRTVSKLVNIGLLHEATGYMRNRIFRADGILKATQDLPD
jgi:Fic family protein